MADRVPKFESSPAVTGHASEALVGGRFCAVSGASVDGNIRVGKPAAKAKCLGVLARDAASGDKVGLYAGKGTIIRVDNTAAAITANDQLEVDANGLVRTVTDGVVVAVAMDDAASSTTCLVRIV